MQRPTALGLTLCDQVIVDRDTSKLSLIGVFSIIYCTKFPTTAHSFTVFAALTDAQERIPVDLVVSRMDTGEVLLTRKMDPVFPNPLHVVNVRYTLSGLPLPVPGTYLFELQVGGEAICHRRLTVTLRENPK